MTNPLQSTRRYGPEDFDDVPTATVYDIFAETASQLVGQFFARAQADPEEERREHWRGQALAIRAVTRQIPARSRSDLLMHIRQWQAEIARLESR